MARKKTWQEKLHDDQAGTLPRVVKIEGNMTRRWGEGTAVIATAFEVDGIMRKVRKGRLITINEIRGILARRHGATIACPITTGIFAFVAAHAAEEAAEQGESRTTPYWRTLKTGGELNPKYPGGVERVAALLAAEGHTVIQKGKRWIVENFENKLAQIAD